MIIYLHNETGMYMDHSDNEFNSLAEALNDFKSLYNSTQDTPYHDFAEKFVFTNENESITWDPVSDSVVETEKEFAKELKNIIISENVVKKL